MLMICPVRPGDENEELRYAIRSWEAHLHLGSDLQLMTVGHQPPWLAPDHHVDGNRYKSAPLAVFDNVRLGAERAVALGHDEVVYMNDDFFCLDPVGKILMVRRNISLAKHITSYPHNAGLWWPRSLRLTAEWLDELGYEDPHSYEVHRPLPADPQAMLTALSKWDIKSRDTVPQWRTVYGVLNAIEAHPVTDVKLSPRTIGIGSPWVSTSDQNWRRYAGMIRPRFQKPSRWEWLGEVRGPRRHE